jgi:hypothetical protein
MCQRRLGPQKQLAWRRVTVRPLPAPTAAAGSNCTVCRHFKATFADYTSTVVERAALTRFPPGRYAGAEARMRAVPRVQEQLAAAAASAATARGGRAGDGGGDGDNDGDNDDDGGAAAESGAGWALAAPLRRLPRFFPTQREMHAHADAEGDCGWLAAHTTWPYMSSAPRGPCLRTHAAPACRRPQRGLPALSCGSSVWCMSVRDGRPPLLRGAAQAQACVALVGGDGGGGHGGWVLRARGGVRVLLAPEPGGLAHPVRAAATVAAVLQRAGPGELASECTLVPRRSNRRWSRRKGG